MVKRGARYTPQEAKARIYEVARRLALDVVDLGIALDKYPINSHEVERRMWVVSGEAGFLNRLCHVVWKYEAFQRGIREETT